MRARHWAGPRSMPPPNPPSGKLSVRAIAACARSLPISTLASAPFNGSRRSWTEAPTEAPSQRTDRLAATDGRRGIEGGEGILRQCAPRIWSPLLEHRPFSKAVLECCPRRLGQAGKKRYDLT